LGCLGLSILYNTLCFCCIRHAFDTATPWLIYLALLLPRRRPVYMVKTAGLPASPTSVFPAVLLHCEIHMIHFLL
jgi:hypothetical protein